MFKEFTTNNNFKLQANQPHINKLYKKKYQTHVATFCFRLNTT